MFRVQCGWLALICFFFIGLATAGAQAGGIKLDSREYKLMLAPGKFAGEDEAAKVVDRFWHEALKPIIDGRLDTRHDGTPRSKNAFKPDSEQRHVLFRDTEDCLLDHNGYSFRERVRLKNGDEKSNREVTLKFRTPDLFLASETALKGSNEEASTKFEEDIAPVIVSTFDQSAHTSRVVVQPRSMRSLFSLSTKETVGPDETFEVLGDVMQAYPDLRANLRKAGAPNDVAGSRLVAGIVIQELVFEGAKVDLGQDTDAEFALTLWYSQNHEKSSEPLTAEISFKYDTDDGRVNEAVAQRALKLFQAMQEGLGAWSSPEHATKSSLALPACQ
jgi:hypothetical protein